MKNIFLLSLLLIISLGLVVVFERTGNLSSRLVSIYQKPSNENTVVKNQNPIKLTHSSCRMS